MKSVPHTVSIYVEVYDKQALIQAARDKAEADGAMRSNVTDYRDALRWLLDPGVSPPGMSIIDSNVE